MSVQLTKWNGLSTIFTVEQNKKVLSRKIKLLEIKTNLLTNEWQKIKLPPTVTCDYFKNN